MLVDCSQGQDQWLAHAIGAQVHFVLSPPRLRPRHSSWSGVLDAPAACWWAWTVVLSMKCWFQSSWQRCWASCCNFVPMPSHTPAWR